MIRESDKGPLAKKMDIDMDKYIEHGMNMVWT